MADVDGAYQRIPPRTASSIGPAPGVRRQRMERPVPTALIPLLERESARRLSVRRPQPAGAESTRAMAAPQPTTAVASMNAPFDSHTLPKVTLTGILTTALVVTWVRTTLPGTGGVFVTRTTWTDLVALGGLAGALVWSHPFVPQADLGAADECGRGSGERRGQSSHAGVVRDRGLDGRCPYRGRRVRAPRDGLPESVRGYTHGAGTTARTYEPSR